MGKSGESLVYENVLHLLLCCVVSCCMKLNVATFHFYK